MPSMFSYTAIIGSGDDSGQAGSRYADREEEKNRWEDGEGEGDDS